MQPERIGAAGGSYGGAIALSLAALRDRKMLPDGALVPWTSRAGVPMQIAVAAPRITWSDFAYSMMPNGSTLDYLADAPYTGPTGVRKQSQEDGALWDRPSFYYVAEGGDPDADIWNWHALMAAGEPYDDAVATRLPRDRRHGRRADRAPLAVLHRPLAPPAPMLLSNGWTDDLFPADEAIRYYNRTRTEYPARRSRCTPWTSATRAAGQVRGPRAAERARARNGSTTTCWARDPAPVVRASRRCTQTCSSSAPSGGPYRAPTLAALAPGEVTLHFAEQRIIFAWGGDQAIADAFDPEIGGGAA